MLPLASTVPELALGKYVRGLFAQGEQGVWYDPSDMSTLFQDAAGTTPVTAVEQPVGLMLDKSKGLVLGPDLVTGYDAGYINTDQTGETLQPDPAALTTQWFPVTGGKTYKLTPTGGTSNRCRIQVKDSSGVITYLTGYSGERAANSVAVPLTTSVQMRVYFRGAGFTATGLQVQALAGKHATQPTATSRPVLSARYNLLTKTEQFDDAVWGKTGVTVTPDAATSPAGSATADLVTVSAENPSTPAYGINGITAPGVTCKYTVWLRADTPTTLILQIPDAAFSSYLAQQSVNVTSEWQLFSVTFTGQAGAIWHRGGAIGQNYYIWGADLRVANDGINLPPYQRVNTATDYDTAGFPPYLRFDGIDDWLVTPSIDFTGTDKMTVCAGVRKLSDATAAIAELSPDTNTSNGVAALFWDSSGWWRYSSKGTVRSNADIPAASGAVTGVLSGLGDISGDRATLRVNGTQVAQSTADQGAGNFGNYPLYIGRRGGTSLPFNGRLYSLLVAGRLLSDRELTSAEKYANDKTRAFA